MGWEAEAEESLVDDESAAETVGFFVGKEEGSTATCSTGAETVGRRTTDLGTAQTTYHSLRKALAAKS